MFILHRLVTIGSSFAITYKEILDDCETPTWMTRGWQNKQIGREFKTILSGHLFILRRLVRIGKQFRNYLKRNLFPVSLLKYSSLVPKKTFSPI